MVVSQPHTMRGGSDIAHLIRGAEDDFITLLPSGNDFLARFFLVLSGWPGRFGDFGVNLRVVTDGAGAPPGSGAGVPESLCKAILICSTYF